MALQHFTDTYSKINKCISNANRFLLHISVPLLCLQCWSSNRKEARPNNHKFNLKMCWSNVVSIKYNNTSLNSCCEMLPLAEIY